MKRNWYLIALYLSVIAWAITLITMLAVLAKACSADDAEMTEAEIYLVQQDDGRLHGDDVPATQRCYMTEEEIEEDFRENYENLLIEQALLAKATKIENVIVTHYCCEKRPHICGNGDGITASGVAVVPEVTVAVDPRYIPLGADVLVDFGDGVIHYYKAADTGGAIKGNKRIDIAVATHAEALERGKKTATVYWVK